jgi:hypothetical protein
MIKTAAIADCRPLPLHYTISNSFARRKAESCRHASLHRSVDGTNETLIGTLRVSECVYRTAEVIGRFSASPCVGVTRKVRAHARSAAVP